MEEFDALIPEDTGEFGDVFQAIKDQIATMMAGFQASLAEKDATAEGLMQTIAEMEATAQSLKAQLFDKMMGSAEPDDVADSDEGEETTEGIESLFEEEEN